MSIDLPRSVVAALWLGALRRDPTLLPPALVAVQGQDEPHRTGDGQTLEELLSRLVVEAEVVHAALPVPGAPGVPAGAAEEALAAQEAVLVRGPGGQTTTAIPVVTEFGSAWEPGAMVTWQVVASSAVVPMPDSLGEARRDLTEALELAIDALTQMDVAQWREEAATEIATLASAEVPASVAQVLPPGLDVRARDLLVRAARLQAIVALAAEDDGAAVNVWQVDQRAAAMRHVGGTARRAMVAATLSAG
ncbi:hypothetical protein [Ruania albidiflava]|uniref:hypothetical protein n=1 Tax=Ruania albidiflava TaxID=366586 RepID=UPI0003B67FFA|nr:hypothetical protein [Ruania albidiflava]